MDSGIVVFGLVLGLIVWLSFLQKVVRARRSGSWKRSVLGFSVRVSDSRQPGDYPFRTRVVVGSGSKISCSPAGHAGVSTGDAEFDKTVRLQGPEDLVLASLDADARRSIAALVGMGGEVKPNGDIVLQHNGQLYGTPLLDEIAGLMAAVATALSAVEPDQVAAAMARNAAGDPEPGVRMRNLKLLLKTYRDSPAARAAAAAGLRDADPAVRLCAASFAKDPGMLRQLVADASVAGPVRAEALRHAWEGSPETVMLALDSGVEEVEIVALQVAAVGRHASMLDRVLALANGASDRLAEATAKALGAFQDPRVQPALLDLVRRDSREVRRAAAWSLGQIGAVETVEPLLQLAGQDPFEDVQDAARLAVRRIQSRLGAVDEGRLSVTESSDEGALSVAPDEGGVSLADQGRTKTR